MIFYWQITKISCIFALRNGNDNSVLKEILSKNMYVKFCLQKLKWNKKENIVKNVFNLYYQ